MGILMHFFLYLIHLKHQLSLSYIHLFKIEALNIKYKFTCI